MKFRKLLAIILVLGLLAVYYIYGTGYLKQRNHNAALASQITRAAQQLAQIPPPPGDLTQLQATARANLDIEKSAFPAQLNSTLMVTAILKLAEDAGVKAIPLVTQPWTTESVNQTDYPVFRLNIAAKGTYAHLADFINRLENGKPETLVIGDLAVERVNGLSTDEPEALDNIPVEGSLNIIIYARPIFAEDTSKVDDK